MRLIVLLLSLFLAGAVGAQQPAPATPSTEQNVKDQQERPVTQPGNNAPFFREVRGGALKAGKPVCSFNPGAIPGGAFATAR